MRVLVCQPTTENMRASFARRFPEHEFIYEEHPSDELLASAEAIFGCPEPERLGACEKLRFMQLSSAGAERYRDAAPAAAALDVVSPEPLPPEHRLWGCENAIITPHVAGKSFSPDIIESIGELFERNFAAFLAGEPLVTPVDRETGYMRSRR